MYGLVLLTTLTLGTQVPHWGPPLSTYTPNLPYCPTSCPRPAWRSCQVCQPVYQGNYGYTARPTGGNWMITDCYGTHGVPLSMNLAVPMPGYAGNSIPVPPATPVPGNPLPLGPAIPNPGNPVPPEIKPGSQLPREMEKGKTSSLLEQARLRVDLPENARLFVDDRPIPSGSSASRSFQTPLLERGEAYYYEVRVEMPQNGRMVSETRRVAIRAGEDIQVSFNFQEIPPFATAQVLPRP